MKHFYISLLALVTGSGVMAQGVLPVSPLRAAQPKRTVSALPQTSGNRVDIWTNDCNINSCSDWVFDNASDIAGQPWTGIDINFECTTDGPSGPYNQWAGGTGGTSVASPMNSTTAANGLIIVDSDLFGADANYSADWVENCWFQNADAIDCSAHPYVSISFQTRYRCWDNGGSDDSEKCLVEVSRDGVNWPDVNSSDPALGTVDYGDGPVQSRWEVFPGYETSDQSDNPSIIELDITEAAGGQGMVYVRFRWVGTWGYSWEIDDVVVYETPANDVRIDNYYSYTDENTTGIYEYGAWPESQLIPLDFAAKVYNIGYVDQTGTALEGFVNGASVGNSSAIDLNYQNADTLRVSGVEITGGPGLYEVSYTVSSDNDDENPTNNTATQSFEVTTLQWGRDDGSFTGLFPSDGADDFIACNPFQVFGDVTVYAIDVAISSNSEEGTPIIAHLFDGADENFLVEQYGGLIVSTSELDLASNFTNTGEEEEVIWYTLVLQEPYTAAAGDLIAAGFEHYGGSEVQIYESKYTPNSTSFVYGPFGSGGAYDWYYTNEVPMVRLNLNPDATNSVSVADVTNEAFALFPAFPNPTQDNARVQYRLDRAGEVSFEVRDVTGKLVFAEDRGTQSAGYHSLTLDVSAWGSGVYAYTIAVDGARATQRLIVR
jgi:hypothetical protein